MSQDHVRIDLYVHLPADGATSAKLDTLLALARASAIRERYMTKELDAVKQLVTEIDTETNAVAAKVDAQAAKIAELKAVIEAGGTVSATDLQAVADALTPISVRLKTLGADPAVPIPPPVG
jgi:hypothetical protein